MKKLLSIIFIGILCLALPALGSANTLKAITLTDGTVIKGTVTGFSNGTYTVETKNLGVVEVDDADIVNISTGKAVVTAETEAPNLGMDPALVKRQVSAMQGVILNDQALMEDMKKLLDDPEIMDVISDKDFMKTLMTYDQKSIENNPKTQQLINNPEIQKMMQKLNNKLGQN